MASITPHFASKSHVLVFAHYAIDGWQSHTPHHTTQYTALNSKQIEYIDCGVCELTSCVHMMNLNILSVIMRFLANLHEWQVNYVVVIVLVSMLAQTWRMSCAAVETWRMSCAVVANAIFRKIFASWTLRKHENFRFLRIQNAFSRFPAFPFFRLKQGSWINVERCDCRINRLQPKSKTTVHNNKNIQETSGGRRQRR